MGTVKLLIGILMIGIITTSCYTDRIIEDDYIEIIEEPSVNINAVLQSRELWYVDINATQGTGEVPFLQRAFTVSFDRGVFYANNNIVGIGKTGNGFGIDTGVYNTLRGAVQIDHDVDGRWILDVSVINNNTLEIYDADSNTSYFLKGYSRSNFDYDALFYDNIHYFLEEYDAWEKVYTSEEGAINDFDAENFLQFIINGGERVFKSSIDVNGTSVSNLQWDYEGAYEVYDVANDATLKTLTLDYDFLGNDYFELYVINDNTIELYHPNSKTTYEFKGKGYREYLKTGKSVAVKKRKKITNKVMHVTKSKR